MIIEKCVRETRNRREKRRDHKKIQLHFLILKKEERGIDRKKNKLTSATAIWARIGVMDQTVAIKIFNNSMFIHKFLMVIHK